MTTEERMNAAQKLKACGVCKLDADPKGGVEVRDKWHCAKCWMNFFNKRHPK